MYKLLKGGHNRWENGQLVKYPRGSTLELTEEEVKFLGDRVQLVSDQIDEGAALESENVNDDGDDGNGTNGDSDFSFLSGLSWQDAVQAVNSLDTLDDLVQARDYETANKGRASVVAAAERKIAALSSVE